MSSAILMFSAQYMALCRLSHVSKLLGAGFTGVLPRAWAQLNRRIV